MKSIIIILFLINIYVSNGINTSKFKDDNSLYFFNNLYKFKINISNKIKKLDIFYNLFKHYNKHKYNKLYSKIIVITKRYIEYDTDKVFNNYNITYNMSNYLSNITDINRINNLIFYDNFTAYNISKTTKQSIIISINQIFFKYKTVTNYYIKLLK